MQTQTMQFVRVIMLIAILGLFAIAVTMLLAVCAVYRRHAKLAITGDTNRSRLLHDAMEDFSAIYKTFGQETNTPAIISSVLHADMRFCLFCERFLNNAVSLFVTLGLLGTFLGLSMSVSSLAQLLGDTSDWQNALSNMGNGLLSALSGMGVAFYTSLVGVSCSIVFTILKAIFNPESIRADLENEMELWLDHRTAPRLSTDKVSGDSEIVKAMTASMNTASNAMERTMKDSITSLQQSLEGFNDTVSDFNRGVRDFSEFDYNLRGTVERLDIAVREFSEAVRKATRGSERGDRQ